MAKSIHLEDAIEEYLELSSLTHVPGTTRGHKSCLYKLLKEAGNIYTKNLGTQHAVMMLKLLSKTQQPATIRTEFSRLRAFTTFCRENQYIAVGLDPFAMKTPRVPEKEKFRLPPTEFGNLLDAASGPIERAALALGLYLYVRQGEMRTIKIRDWDVDGCWMHIHVHKTKSEDDMPIGEQLDDELRSYMQWYRANSPVPLTPEHYLIPGRTAPQIRGVKGVFGAANFTRVIRPEVMCTRPEQYVQTAMRRLGYDTHTEDGKSLSEGFHTLRRSGARALYDDLIDSGHDGAGRTVQAMLHHKHFSTTELYLGIGLDKKRRDDLIRRQPMYGQQRGRVLRLVAGEGQ